MVQAAVQAAVHAAVQSRGVTSGNAGERAPLAAGRGGQGRPAIAASRRRAGHGSRAGCTHMLSTPSSTQPAPTCTPYWPHSGRLASLSQSTATKGTMPCSRGWAGGRSGEARVAGERQRAEWPQHRGQQLDCGLSAYQGRSSSVPQSGQRVSSSQAKPGNAERAVHRQGQRRLAKRRRRSRRTCSLAAAFV